MYLFSIIFTIAILIISFVVIVFSWLYQKSKENNFYWFLYLFIEIAIILAIGFQTKLFFNYIDNL